MLLQGVLMKIFQVDAFTDKPFKGNPAVICIPEKTISLSLMQSLAMEMGVSETAYLIKEEHGYRLRWFTPTTEVSLCGHATLASAHILWEEKILKKNEEAYFNTLSGILIARKVNDWIEMDFPARIVNEVPEDLVLNKALGIRPTFTGNFDTPDGKLYLVEVESEGIVNNIMPDFNLLLKSKAMDVIVTAKSDKKEYDFVSRFFAPAFGINEDPVTGSAHCYLTPYWSVKLNKKELIAYQTSPRSGLLVCTWKEEKVFIRGKAVTIFRGEVTI